MMIITVRVFRIWHPREDFPYGYLETQWVEPEVAVIVDYPGSGVTFTHNKHTLNFANRHINPFGPQGKQWPCMIEKEGE